ncbi:MAG: CBS domain-containing protein [Myxococcales bacterium]|nr:CBS domain-containing protein [Myxococcales bacterium]
MAEQPAKHSEIVPHLASGQAAGPAETTPVSKIMTKNVVCVPPDLGLEALTGLFLDRGISGAPVVDASGRTLGVVSKTDVLREHQDRGDTAEQGEPEVFRDGIRAGLDRGMHVVGNDEATVKDVMTPLAFTVAEGTSIARAAALMALEGVHRVPVASAAGKVVGILSALDILRWLAQEEGYRVPDPHA